MIWRTSRRAGTERVFELVETAPEAWTHHVLTRQEIEVVELLASGKLAKWCGIELGLSASRISSLLASAASKIGVASRLELLRLAGLVVDPPSVHERSRTARALGAHDREPGERVRG